MTNLPSSLLEELRDPPLDDLTDGYWSWDLKENCYYSPKLQQLFGYHEDEIPSCNGWKELTKNLNPKNCYDLLDEVLKKGKDYWGEFQYTHKNGSTVWVLSRGKLIYNDDGQPIQMIGTHTNITALKKAEMDLYTLAHTDDLTKLANRKTFLEQLEKNAQAKTPSFALLFIDIDDFKKINDKRGHQVGDQLLRAAAVLMQRTTRTSDFIARIGGDEFGVILNNVSSAEEVSAITDRYMAAFEAPIQVGDDPIHTSLSIGIAIHPIASDSAVELLKFADIAMYRAKARGKCRYVFYKSDINQRANRRDIIERQLELAIERNEFSVHYQPQLNLKTNKISGVEALLRWHNSVLGEVPPQEFIPIAEQARRISQIGEWLIHQVFRDVATMKKHMNMDGVHISLNISGLQFLDERLLIALQKMFEGSDVDPNKVILEVTESILMQQTPDTQALLKQLNQLGVQLAIDDFGTGYSSIKYLRDLPISIVKIDQCFIHDIGITKNNDAVLKAIMLLCHSLDLKVIAEGVETKHQLNFLKLVQSDYIQGFYVSKALPTNELIQQFSTMLEHA